MFVRSRECFSIDFPLQKFIEEIVIIIPRPPLCK